MAIIHHFVKFDGIIDIIEYLPELLLTIAKRLFCLLPFGDICQEERKPDDIPVFIRNRVVDIFIPTAFERGIAIGLDHGE